MFLRTNYHMSVTIVIKTCNRCGESFLFDEANVSIKHLEPVNIVGSTVSKCHLCPQSSDRHPTLQNRQDFSSWDNDSWKRK